MAEKNEFETSLKRLDEIVDQISSKALPLDSALKLYEEGAKIIEDLEKKLNESKEKIEKIVEIK